MAIETTKHISENPSGNAVTAPYDPKKSRETGARALQMYGIIQAFREGKYPSNRQISETLDYAGSNAPLDVSKLSKDGRMLVQDFRNIIKTSKRIVETKNADELFQNFMYHSRHVDTGKGNLKDVNTPVKKDDLKNDGEQAVEHLRTLGKLIFTNSEARKLLKDIGILGRDVAADAAAKVSDTARPADHELEKVDEPAPSNQWVGPDGETRGHNDPAPDTGLAAKRDEMKSKKDDMKREAQEEQQASQQRVQDASRNATHDNMTDEEKARAAKEAGKEQAKAEKDDKKNKLVNRIPDEHKEKAKEQINKAKDYAADKFPEERRNRFIYRLKKVVVENQRHRDYQEAIEFFLDRAETYHAHGKDLSKQGAGQGANVRNDSAFQQAEKELRTLLERFANNQSSQPIFDAVDQLYTDASNDEELKRWFKELDSYVRAVLQEPGYIMKDQSDKDGRALLDKGKRFWDPKEGKYAPHKDNFFNAVSNFFQAYADDELNVQLGEDVKKLTKDLLMDADGNLKYKPHLWNDIRSVIIPTMAKSAGLIPIPRVEYTDHTVDLVVENLTLESRNIFPNIIELEAKNYFKISPYDAIKDASKHSFVVSFAQVQADFKDVAFYIKKKTGFPRVTDSGLADIVISGKGISGKIHVESTGRKDHAFKVVDVKVKIDKLKFALRQSKFSFVSSLPLMTSIVKKAVAKAIEEGIRGGLVQLDAQLADIHERMEEAKNSDDSGTMFDRFKGAYNDKKAEAEHNKAKAEEKSPDGKFQVTGKRDSKLVNWSSPHSLVEEQGTKQDLAKDGQGWKSPAFDIVGANASNVKSVGGSHDRAYGNNNSSYDNNTSRTTTTAPTTTTTTSANTAQYAPANTQIATSTPIADSHTNGPPPAVTSSSVPRA